MFSDVEKDDEKVKALKEKAKNALIMADVSALESIVKEAEELQKAEKDKENGGDAELLVKEVSYCTQRIEAMKKM
eukprot:CAMPEP_0116878562 /NCGR_PEP_ID=MMETSP0463-20121206/10309_1 /TAXON_ID=181622 /ORGANISM="Strombidinopsis sp, Strain SopsisLIS2011" /LENGTH=74 /DNA_ID=CAMNT_0004526901 /DNA_START=389 /DNA_END=613 /DNA_ORIENTATION=+